MLENALPTSGGECRRLSPLPIKSSPSHNRQEKYTTDSISPSRIDTMACHANDNACVFMMDFMVRVEHGLLLNDVLNTDCRMTQQWQ
ncbi:MAG: hypothetical protein ACTH5W_04410 [Providencia sp.]|uniref:hypothetical protein n=1 Tax=Providencia sp. TaxID=589 RepID=UPI002AB59105|nr:hypothetical protein [Providencia rettgeri]